MNKKIMMIILLLCVFAGAGWFYLQYTSDTVIFDLQIPSASFLKDKQITVVVAKATATSDLGHDCAVMFDAASQKTTTSCDEQKTPTSNEAIIKLRYDELDKFIKIPVSFLRWGDRYEIRIRGLSQDACNQVSMQHESIVYKTTIKIDFTTMPSSGTHMFCGSGGLGQSNSDIFGSANVPVQPVKIKTNTPTQPSLVNANIQNICLADYKHGQHPGVLKAHHCVIAYGSDAISLPHFTILPKGNYSWIEFNGGRQSIPQNAVVGGQEPIIEQGEAGLRTLYICRVNNNDHQIGKVVDGVCNFVEKTQSRQFSVYQILVLQKNN